MRTLRQLDNDALDKAKVGANEMCGAGDNYFGITKNEIIAMQANARMDDKYREMHSILKDVEEYLGKITHPYPASHAKLLERIKSV